MSVSRGYRAPPDRPRPRAIPSHARPTQQPSASEGGGEAPSLGWIVRCPGRGRVRRKGGLSQHLFPDTLPSRSRRHTNPRWNTHKSSRGKCIVPFNNFEMFIRMYNQTKVQAKAAHANFKKKHILQKYENPIDYLRLLRNKRPHSDSKRFWVYAGARSVDLSSWAGER